MKKAPKSLQFIDSSRKAEGGLPKDDKEPPSLGVKEEAQSFFDSQKGSKNVTIEKKVKKIDFMRESYDGHELSYVTLYGNQYLKKG